MDAADLHDTSLIEHKSDIRRLFDAAPLNALANDSTVRPSCGGDGKSALDFSAFVSDDRNHAVAWDAGAFLFQWSAPQTYEVHVMIRPEGRGQDGYRRATQGIAYIVACGAERLWARVAKAARGLRHYVAQAGFTRCGTDTLDIGFGPITYDLYQWKKPCLQQS